MLACIVMTISSMAAQAFDTYNSKVYKVEPPDVLRIEVTGLSKKAQPIKGEFQVGPDGKISLGEKYGQVDVSSLTIDQIRKAITEHLSAHAKKPSKLHVQAEVSDYNSKKFYIIVHNASKEGDTIQSFPATGNETVAAAVLQVEGLAVKAIKGYVWVDRPEDKKKYDVEWDAIMLQGKTGTNFKLLPGDRVFVTHNKRSAEPDVKHPLGNYSE